MLKTPIKDITVKQALAIFVMGHVVNIAMNVIAIPLLRKTRTWTEELEGKTAQKKRDRKVQEAIQKDKENHE